MNKKLQINKVNHPYRLTLEHLKWSEKRKNRNKMGDADWSVKSVAAEWRHFRIEDRSGRLVVGRQERRIDADETIVVATVVVPVVPRRRTVLDAELDRLVGVVRGRNHRRELESVRP